MRKTFFIFSELNGFQYCILLSHSCTLNVKVLKETKLYKTHSFCRRETFVTVAVVLILCKWHQGGLQNGNDFLCFRILMIFSKSASTSARSRGVWRFPHFTYNFQIEALPSLSLWMDAAAMWPMSDTSNSAINILQNLTSNIKQSLSSSCQWCGGDCVLLTGARLKLCTS